MIDLVKLKEDWAWQLGPNGGTVSSQEFAAVHFDELIEEIELLRKQCEDMWHEIAALKKG